MSDNLPATTSGVGTDVVGLEDMDEGQSLPRININHKDAVFEDSMSGEKFDSRRVILLGMVTQRVLWPPELGDDPGPPLCRSFDARTAYPGEEFPWKQSNFEQVGEGECLSCSECKFADWDTHPKRAKVSWCTEQYVVPALMNPDENNPDAAIENLEDWVPGLFTFQRAGIKNTKRYFQGYRRERLPLFTYYTLVGLEAQRRGNVDYATPTFRRMGKTPAEMHDEMADIFLKGRAFLQEPRFFKSEDDDEETPAQAKTKSNRPPAEIIEDAFKVDDDEPF